MICKISLDCVNKLVLQLYSLFLINIILSFEKEISKCEKIFFEFQKFSESN